MDALKKNDIEVSKNAIAEAVKKKAQENIKILEVRK